MTGLSVVVPRWMQLEKGERERKHLGCASCTLFWNADSVLEIQVLSWIQAGGKWEFFCTQLPSIEVPSKGPSSFPWLKGPLGMGQLHAVTEELHCPHPVSVHFTPLPHQKGSVCKPQWGRMGPWLRPSSGAVLRATGTRECLESLAHPPALLAGRQNLTWSRPSHMKEIIKRVWVAA